MRPQRPRTLSVKKKGAPGDEMKVQWRRGLALAGESFAICVAAELCGRKRRTWTGTLAGESAPARIGAPGPPPPPDAGQTIDAGENGFVQPLRHVVSHAATATNHRNG